MKFPTGGIPDFRGARERSFMIIIMRSSRSGEMPEPTVTVRMEEDMQSLAASRPENGHHWYVKAATIYSCALILVNY